LRESISASTLMLILEAAPDANKALLRSGHRIRTPRRHERVRARHTCCPSMIHTHTHTHTHTHIYLSIYLSIHIHIYVYVYIGYSHVCASSQSHTHTHIHTLTHIHTHTLSLTHRYRYRYRYVFVIEGMHKHGFILSSLMRECLSMSVSHERAGAVVRV